MRQNNVLQVYYDERHVGTLAMTADYKVAFQYCEEWLGKWFPYQSIFIAFKKTSICSNQRLF